MNKSELDEMINVLDIFAAPGGFSDGFRQAGFRIKGAIDKERWGCMTLRYNFRQKTAIIEKDITNLSIKYVENTLNTNQIGVIIGSPPCQGFSKVGRIKLASLNNGKYADDKRNHLYMYFLKFVEYFNPVFVIIENVQEILSYNNGNIANNILYQLEKIGYKSEVKIVNSAWFGVPQNRKRAIFIGNNIGIKNLWNKIFLNIQNKTVSVGNAISDLNILQHNEGKEVTHYNKNHLTEYQIKMRNSKYLFNHVARCHNNRDLKYFADLEEGESSKQKIKFWEDYPYNKNSFTDKYRRLDSSKPSPTITAHIHKDGLSYIHPTQLRSITVREAARIQSFRDSFRFMGPRTAQYKQVGNAVPPLMVTAIANEIKKIISSL